MVTGHAGWTIQLLIGLGAVRRARRVEVLPPGRPPSYKIHTLLNRANGFYWKYTGAKTVTMDCAYSDLLGEWEKVRRIQRS